MRSGNEAAIAVKEIGAKDEQERATPLFRQAAVDSKSTKYEGTVIKLQPLGFRGLILGVVAFAVLLVAFGLFGTYSRTIRVSGVLTPLTGVKTVFTTRRGVVDSVAVRTGDDVVQGDRLFTLSHARRTASGADVDADIELLVRASLVEAEKQKEYTHQLDVIEQRKLQRELSSVDADLKNLNERAKIQNKRVNLLRADVTGLGSLLEENLVAETFYRDKQDAYLIAQLENMQIVRERAAKIKHASDAELGLKQSKIDTKYKLAELNRNISELKKQLIEIDAGRSTTVLAPSDGIVSTILISEGDEANSNRPVIKLLPHSTVLQAELYLPAASVGTVGVDDDVNIRYQAFPYQRFGTFGGRIINISRTSLMPHEITAPYQLKEPAYRVDVELNEQEISIFGNSESYPLLPGMIVDVDIIGQKLRIVEWLLEPIALVKGRFFE